MENRPDHSPQRFSFGRFILSVPERQLFRGAEPVPIGSRAFDLLIALVKRPGQVIGKRQLIEFVWGEVSVDDGALRVHINTLRKALRDGEDGARYIATVPGQGYSFVAAVSGTNSPALDVNATDGTHLTDLPPVLRRMIGRKHAVASLAARIIDLRFVSLVGPGGIGKTTVAIEALHQLRGKFDGDIHFINLSVVTDAGLVDQTVASMIGATKGAGNPTSDLLDHLRRRKCLLVLDSCEHVIEPVATLASVIIEKAPLTHLLTTTREPLRIEGEQVVRLPSLDCPPEDVVPTAAGILNFPAVELFVERVLANVPAFGLTDDNAPVVADICRKLDGIALAIELTAGHVEAYGLVETARLLERRLGLLWRGRRAAPPRHQTLHGTIEWSYDLLEAAERDVFVRLAVFAGPFTLTAAEAVATDDGMHGPKVVEIIGSLVAKSLLSPVTSRLPQRYRLLDTTRTYALEKLARSSEQPDVCRRHAQFFVAELQRTASGRARSSESFMEHLNDVRSAFEWCFVREDDKSVGVALAAVAAAPLVEHSLCTECQRWMELAISHLSEAQRGTALELELQISLGWSAMFSAGKGEAGHGAFLRGLAIADSDPDPYQRLRLLNGLSFVTSRKGDLAGGLNLAKQAAEIARQTVDKAVIARADWNLGVYHHLCGNQDLVRTYCESALAPTASSSQASKISDYGYDYRGRALIARARALCLLGFPQQGTRATQFAIDVAEQSDHPLSRFVVLVHAAIAFIWCNEWHSAKAAIRALQTDTQTHSLIYQTMGSALDAMLNCRRFVTADIADIKALRQSLERLVEERHLILVPMCRVTLAETLLEAGSPDEAGAIVDVALDDLGSEFIGAEGAEILRIKGMATVALGHAAAGEEYLLRAIDVARSQSALWWELRAATSLARIKVESGEAGACAELEAVMRRCSEGHDTDDFKAAEQLVASHSSGLFSAPGCGQAGEGPGWQAGLG